MITIEDPPNATPCTQCWRPITWLYSPAHERWIPFVRDVNDPDVARPHRCPPSGKPRTWREQALPIASLDPAAVAARAHRGAALARAALRRAATPTTEEEPE